MKNPFNAKAFFYTIIIGSLIAILFAWVTGSVYATALVPTLTLLTAFILTGIIIGLMTEAITIIEPGTGSIIVSIIAYFVVNSMNLKGFSGLTSADWLLIFLNSVICTFLGSWLGEKLQHGEYKMELSTASLDWSWSVAGSVMGITLSIILINILALLFGPNPNKFFIPFFIGLFLTGYLVGWKSPGITIYEAGITGFLTIIFLFDIARMTLFIDTEMDVSYIITGLIIGFIITLFGGFVGEKVQSAYEKKTE